MVPSTMAVRPCVPQSKPRKSRTEHQPNTIAAEYAARGRARSVVAFAPGLQDLLQRACKIGRRRARLADATLQAYRSRLNAKLDALLHIIPTHAAGEKLKAAIEACWHSLFVFLANRAVPPTNNGSEQALRPCVVFRKVTNCFRSEWAAHLYADIRSVIETARRRAIGVLDAIQQP